MYTTEEMASPVEHFSLQASPVKSIVSLRRVLRGFMKAVFYIFNGIFISLGMSIKLYIHPQLLPHPIVTRCLTYTTTTTTEEISYERPKLPLNGTKVPAHNSLVNVIKIKY